MDHVNPHTSKAHIIPHVASVIPSQSLQFYSWDHINNLKLADPNFYISRHVDLLLGADVYAQLIRPGLVLAPSPRCPSAFNTIFGWVLSGSVQPEQTNERVINSFHVKIMEDCPENDLESTMRQFWQVEEVPMIRLAQTMSYVRNCTLKDLLETLPAEHCQAPFSFDSVPTLTLKVLGLQWSPMTDTFTFRLMSFDQLARVYDPLGYLTPVTFYIKHLLQQIWHSSCDWDDSLPEPLTRQWLKNHCIAKRQL
ncbi:hypothetical protein NQ318_015889 [Aromia moschata]|uniref:Peptidase aspartic putative domain-containing protein n=1 Tax=Aromia moschata TaxID=1265417 RepID=A0AAV8Y2G6_9CUCU|nr:hypothetical protein NQ318_015889 [Aromia moschata]